MLVIRQEQLRLLGGLAMSGYEARLADHFTQFYPRETALAGPDAVRRFVKLGVKRALSYGFKSERDVALYVNLMIMLGCDFDRDPQIPWAGAQVADSSSPMLFRRVQRTFSLALKYLGRISGENNYGIAKAMLRIQDFPFEQQAPSTSGERLEQDLESLLRNFFPEKFEVQGRKANRSLIALGVDLARKEGLVGGQGITLYTTLMFMLGSGFAIDPLYPWASKAFRDPGITSEPARVSNLYSEAMAYLRASLSKTE